MKRQSWLMGSNTTNIDEITDAQANRLWNPIVVLYSKTLNGMFAKTDGQTKVVSDELCNLLTRAGKTIDPTNSEQLAEVYSEIKSEISDVVAKTFSFKGYVGETAPTTTDYVLNVGDMWIDSANMPTTIPIPASSISVWNGTTWESATESYTPATFDTFSDIEDKEGYYWFGGAWKVISTDLSFEYFSLNQTTGKWELNPTWMSNYAKENGIPFWNGTETYSANTLVRYYDNNNGFAFYRNLTGENTSTPPTSDITNWTMFSAGGGGASAGGEMFDVVQKDHSLTFDESKGYVPLGGYAYKEGVSGSRYGYPTFYETCVSEYQAGANTFAGSPWKQYNLALTENGTMGGDTFACESNLTSGANQTYKMFMLTTTTGNTYTSSNSATITFYNPTPLNITKITWETVNNNRNPIEYTVQGSNDGTTYTDIITNQTAPAGAGTTMDMSNNVLYYKYHKILVTSFNTSQGNVKRLIIDAKDGTVPVKKNSNGHIFYDIANKSLVDALYDETGIAWMYGVDTTSERIALPRNDYMARGEKGVVGNGIALGLIDGTNNLGFLGSTGDDMRRGSNAQPNAYGVAVGTALAYQNTTPLNHATGVTTDSTKSGIELVKAGADKYLYMICGTTDEEVAMTEVTEVTTSENDTIPLFTHKYFEFKPNHISWVPANTVQSGSVYTSAYNTLVGCLTSNPYEIKVIDEADEQVGVDYSEYWIVNQTNETFRTPITVSEKALNGGVKGNGMTLGLTNGTINYGLYSTSTVPLAANRNSYNVNVGSSTASTGNDSVSSNLGISTDPTKSGIIAEQSTSRLYFKVDNAVQNLELINVGRIEENKLNTNLQNVDLTSGADAIIDRQEPTAENNYTWYKLYKSGRVEQGGIAVNTSSSANVSITVNLLVEMADINYSIQGTQMRSIRSSDSYPYVLTDSLSTTQFTFGMDANSTVFWEVKGKSAI